MGRYNNPCLWTLIICHTSSAKMEIQLLLIWFSCFVAIDSNPRMLGSRFKSNLKQLSFNASISSILIKKFLPKYQFQPCEGRPVKFLVHRISQAFRRIMLKIHKIISEFCFYTTEYIFLKNVFVESATVQSNFENKVNSE